MLGCWSLAAAAGDPRLRRRLWVGRRLPASEIKLLEKKSENTRKAVVPWPLRCIRTSWRNRANRRPKTLTRLWGPSIPTCWPGRAGQMPGSPFIKSKRCVPRIIYGRCCTETTTPTSHRFLSSFSSTFHVYSRYIGGSGVGDGMKTSTTTGASEPEREREKNSWGQAIAQGRRPHTKTHQPLSFLPLFLTCFSSFHYHSYYYYYYGVIPFSLFVGGRKREEEEEEPIEKHSGIYGRP